MTWSWTCCCDHQKYGVETHARAVGAHQRVKSQNPLTRRSMRASGDETDSAATRKGVLREWARCAPVVVARTRRRSWWALWPWSRASGAPPQGPSGAPPHQRARCADAWGTGAGDTEFGATEQWPATAGTALNTVNTVEAGFDPNHRRLEPASIATEWVDDPDEHPDQGKEESHTHHQDRCRLFSKRDDGTPEALWACAVGCECISHMLLSCCCDWG